MSGGKRGPGPARAGILRSALSLLTGLAMFGVALWVLHRWAARISMEDLAAELERLSLPQVGLALLFTALSFVALVGYEHYAVRFVERRLSLRLVALFSFITQAVAHAVGFAIFVGATLRYKLYAPHHFGIVDIAKIQVFFSTTFGLGVFTLAGGVLLLEPGALVEATGLPASAWRAIGTLLLAGIALLLVWGSLFHRPVRIAGRLIVLPSAGVTLIQIILGILDLVAVAAALHVLLPDFLGLSYAETLGVFVAAIAVGLVSHVPGSLGVFESAVLLLVAPAEEQVAAVIGALIAFRAIYYMLPLACGALLFGLVELRRWSGSGRSQGRVPGRPAG
ncbi:putative bifunctional lysylphosphatidylglycerol flippase/synthetase [Marinimicrococcus flavescens]|uniref:Uncharacterized protein n=1 Tax=Marinimicrococcus flavescens TaxID=3031815 RepID=A0AAP3UY84_9PROT|nr:hypothetical protein [Marinimicrococcus flavescens]